VEDSDFASSSTSRADFPGMRFMILYSGVDVMGRPSSEATVEDAEEPEVRNVFERSDNRVSGLNLSKRTERIGGTFLRIEIGRGRRVLSLRRVVICSNLPFCVPDIERRSLWGAVPWNPFCKIRFQFSSVIVEKTLTE